MNNNIEPLVIEQTKYTPHVLLDARRSVFEIEGRAMLDEMMAVHNKIMDWLKQNLSDIDAAIVLIIRLSYLDSAASKMMAELLGLFDLQYQAGRQITVNWFCALNDSEMYADGEVYASMFKLPIKIHSV